MFTLSCLSPPQHVYCSCTIYRGVSVLCQMMCSLGHISHLIKCLWGCGVGVPRCECVVLWGYIYTLFTLISGHHGINREMCGLEREARVRVFFGEAVTLIKL